MALLEPTLNQAGKPTQYRTDELPEDGNLSTPPDKRSRKFEGLTQFRRTQLRLTLQTAE
jgi:hypothetical protein